MEFKWFFFFVIYGYFTWIIGMHFDVVIIDSVLQHFWCNILLLFWIQRNLCQGRNDFLEGISNWWLWSTKLSIFDIFSELLLLFIIRYCLLWIQNGFLLSSFFLKFNLSKSFIFDYFKLQYYYLPQIDFFPFCMFLYLNILAYF